MKKIYTFALIFIMMLSCVVFSACGDKYKDLEMSFFSTSGNSVESINLIIDKDNESFASISVGVRFSGIDSSDIGEVEIYSKPYELISVSNYRLENDTYYVDITANGAKGSGKLVAKHSSSGKEASIDLNVQLKSDGIALNADTYIVPIPRSGSSTVMIDASEVVSLLFDGEKKECSDSVYFRVVANSSQIQDVTYVTSELDNSLITGFTVKSEVAEGAELAMYPVTYLTGYEPKEYPDYKIVFKFITTLEEDDLYLSTDVNHQKYLDNGDTIHLIAKELDSVTASDGKMYNFNNIQIVLQYISKDETLNDVYLDLDDNGRINYYDYYDIVLSTDNKNVSAYNSNNTIIFQAVDYLDKEVTATIKLVPKDCVGEISQIEKTFKIKPELKPSDIEVEMQGEDVDINYSLDLYDYYVSSGSALGAMFNFNPIVEESYSDLKKMKIRVQPELLNAYKSTNSGYVGINRVYLDENFSNPITNGEYSGHFFRDNKYVLEFYLYNQPMMFYYDAVSQTLVSESFESTDNLYIKYVETDVVQDNYGLGMSVFTYYSGNYEYLEPISSTVIDITFNRLEGVQDLEVNAGYLSQQNNAYTDTLYTDNNAIPYPVSNVYLNRLEGTDNLDVHAYLLYVGPGNVLGDKDRELTSADFEVSVIGGADNPLKIKQYTINDGNGKDNVDNTLAGEQTITYTFNATSGVNNAILFIFNKNTDIGEYEIVFKHDNGYSLSINCFIYQKMTEDDIGYYFEENDKAFKNSSVVESGGVISTEYLYSDYKSDYIVASGQDIELEVILDEYFDDYYVLGYDFSAEFSDITAESVSNYLKVNNYGNKTEISFLKGTYFNDINNYIRLTISVNVQDYLNIITPDGSETINVGITFFIYEEIAKEDIDINIDSEDLYMYEYLGEYYKDQASVSLEIAIDGEDKQYLWNYVQTQTQESNFNIGISETFDKQTGETNKNQYRVIWYTQNNDDDRVITNSQGDKNIDLTFRSGQNVSTYYFDIYAELKQFNTTFRFRSRITVNKPIITEYLTLESEINYTTDERQDYYIDLKAGEEYVVEASNHSNEGEVSNDDIYMVIVDNQGNQNYYNTISVDNNTNTLSVREGLLESITELNLIIFAKDALNQIISNSTAGFDDVSSFLMDGDDENIDAYKNAYIIVSIYLSDGSEANPYIVNDADDFWEINDNPSAHYRVMNNIDLSNTTYTGERVITDFDGSIVTYQNNGTSYVYTLFGINLNSSVVNLFEDMEGSISNINFNVNYQYDIATSSDMYLGLINRNFGRLTNVSVVFNGNAEINVRQPSAPYIYFGALVAENRGKIEYSSNTIVGSQGNINLSGNAVTYFGGLVGRNLSIITGYDNSNANANILNANYSLNNSETDSDTEIIFSVYIANQGAMADVEIISTMTNEDSAIGGIIGINEYDQESAQLVGRLSNAFVMGSIRGKYNIGGAIGINKTPELSSVVTVSSGQISAIGQAQTQPIYYVENVKSNVQIVGDTSVGGIVGSDNGGSYKDVHYQILSSTNSGISASSKVGGIAGSSQYGIFLYCSVMSYRWDYNSLDSITGEADIKGNQYVAGIVGYATGDGISLNENENTVKTVIVQSSSVNAYILADTGSVATSNIGGILSNGNADTDSIIFNAYFMGRIDGNFSYLSSPDQTQHFALSNNTNIIYNNVYSVVFDIDLGELVIGNYSNGNGGMLIGGTSDMSGWVDSDVWAYNIEINGGYIYLLNEDGECLFDIAPTSITALIKDDYKLTYNKNELTSLIHLDYYDFILDSTDENYTTIYNQLNERNNTYKLLDLFDFECTPTSLSELRLYAESSNSAIIYINNDKLIVRGEGKATLTFISILNTSIRASVTVDVSNAIGTGLMISDTSTGENAISSDQYIANGKAKQYYIIATGEKDYNGVQYSYRANEEIYLQVDVSTSKEENSTITYANIPEYLNISGIEGTIDAENESVRYIVDADTPFSISILQYLIDGHFIFKITPYTVINYSDETLENVQINNYLFDSITNFKLYTRLGATNIALNYDSVTLYPNDHTTITAYISTDIELTNDDLNSDLKYSANFYDLETGLNFENIKLQADIEMIRNLGFDESTGLQTVYYRLSILEDAETQSNEPIGLRVTYTLPSGENSSIEFTILPQRINKIEIKNYVYTTEDGANITKSDVLRPVGEGLIIIDIAPSNGYYDYLEISDITGREEIIFAQIDGVKGARLSEMDSPSSDGTGIKLIKNYDGFNGSIYVATMISNRYSSIPHTIRVSAYLNDGEQVGDTFYYTINVKMLPGITVEYLKPNGEVYYTKDNDSAENNTIYIANNVDTRFRINTSNSDGNIDIELDSNYFEMIEDYNNYYILRFKDSTTDLIGNSYTLTFSTTATLENGDYEVATVTLNVKVVEFVIYDISVTHSRVNSSGDVEIYGDYYVPITLEFYFDETDISYYYANSFWNMVYRYDADITESQGGIYYINEILKSLNTDTSNNGVYNKYLSLENYDTDDDGEMKDISLRGNVLEVYDGNIATILNLDYLLCLNEDNFWTITTLNEHNTPSIDGSTEDEVMNYSYNYYLNFVNSNSYEEPEVIASEKDFLTMQSGDNVHYILARDLEFENYVPLDVSVKTFDGNGHTITIKSFASFDEEVIYAGLFREIYDGMIVMNLNVEYLSTNDGMGSYSFGQVSPSTSTFNIVYADICNNPAINYSSAYFGAITPVNNGVITNCSSSGFVALHASTIEAKTTGYNIEFYIGGLVAQNTSTGYITNSTSGLAIFSLANIGGFAYSNEGKIASSCFDASKDLFTYGDQSIAKYSGGGLIFAYNNSVLNTSLVSVAGFVVNNSGEISMSYVESNSTTLRTNNSIGNISAKDNSAGFVYSSTGTIYDCYVDLTKIGANNNKFSGFANENTGSISRCYTYINEGNRSSTEIYMFAPTGTTGVSESYEIINTLDGGYSNNIDGLTSVLTSAMAFASSYPSFTFGDNESAVWYMEEGSTPKLVISLEKVTFNSNQANTESMYYGIRNIRIIKTSVTDDDGHTTEITSYEIINGTYGTRNNPYLIYDIDTWNFYFADGTTHYYRLIKDIDFSSINANPNTSEFTFMGNLQGNNMDLLGLMIYSGSSLNSIGLFRELMSADDVSIKNSIRNIDLNIESILATKTVAVGGLAGIIEDFNVYNIDIIGEGVIVVGANAVGGLAGIARGDFNVETITSNVGVNSTRASSGNRYSIYLSKNNGQEISYNLNSVYYAGSIIGIVDGYQNARFDINDNRDIDSTSYVDVKDTKVYGNITAIGDSVGLAFGFIGEHVRLTDTIVNVDEASILGEQYSAMVIGENRGLVIDAVANSLSENIFANSDNVSSGLVGLNLGGYIENANVSINIIKTSGRSTVAGIIGRNINGTILDSTFGGNLVGYYTGGIIGSDYDRTTLINRTSGAGAIESETKVAVPEDELTYLENGNNLDRISNVSITNNTLAYWLENMKYFYSYNTIIDQTPFNESIRASRVLGLLTGLSNAENTIYKISYDDENITFNGDASNSYIGAINGAILYNGMEYDIPYSNIIDAEVENSYVTYILGATIATFDAWNGDTYSNSRLVFTSEKDKISNLDYMISKAEGEDSQIYNDFYISTDNANTIVNNAIYSFNLNRHTNRTIQPEQEQQFNMYYEFILTNFDENSNLTVTITNTDADGNVTTGEIVLSAEDISSQISNGNAYITFNPGKKVEINFAGIANEESVSVTYIFNFLDVV